MNDDIEGSGPIRVADITIAQLSRGLYRSTATALKELVANAYDADAPVVRIDTNYPAFDFISCVDNGKGMPLKEFKRFFADEGIGSCIKRKHGKDTTDEYGRPIIGKLGIGMLALGQLCHSFEIESHYRDENGKGKAYRADIVLEDTSIPDREDISRNSDEESKEMEVGKWHYDASIPYDARKQGFRVFSDDVRSTFRREMSSSIGKKEAKQLSFSLSDLYSRFYDKAEKSIRDCKSYLETIWELSILCPLPYYGNQREFPIRLESFSSEENQSGEFARAIAFINRKQKRFLDDKFRVIFDGIKLRRHIQFPTEEKVVPRLYSIEFAGDVFDSPLEFAGYIFAQVPRAIRPAELNGLQIRLRGVGVGGYDSTFLRYYKEIETIRSRWVSGEIFVDKGLESALNIDRDSFNEHDEHFKKMQSLLHDKLNKVFDEIDRIGRQRSENTRSEKEQETRANLETLITRESGGALKLQERDLGAKIAIVRTDKERGEIVLNTAVRPLRGKKANSIIRAVMLAYHAAKQTTKTEEERDSKFYQLVKDILGKLI